MAYGIELRNELGEEILEFQKTLYVSERGQTTSWNDLHIESYNKCRLLGMQSSPFNPPWYNNFIMTRIHPPPWIMGDPLGTEFHVCSDAGEAYVVSPSSRATYLGLPKLRPLGNELAFYQLGSAGLFSNVQTYITMPSTPNGVLHMCGSQNVNGLPYTIAIAPDTIPLSGYYPSSHGMRMWDEAGNLVFDSREELFSVFETIYIPKQTFEDVLTTGSTVVLNMSKAAPNVMMACPYYCSFFNGYRNGAYYRDLPTIRQTSPSQLTISRYSTAFNPNNTPSYPDRRVNRYYTHDAIIFLARSNQ